MFTCGYNLTEAKAAAIEEGYNEDTMIGFAIGSPKKEGKVPSVGMIHCFVEKRSDIKKMWRPWMHTLNFHFTRKDMCHMYGDIDAPGWDDHQAIEDWITKKLIPAAIKVSIVLVFLLLSVLTLSYPCSVCHP